MEIKQKAFVIIPFTVSVILITLGVIMGDFFLLDVEYPAESESKIILLAQSFRTPIYETPDGKEFFLNSIIDFETSDVFSINNRINYTVSSTASDTGFFDEFYFILSPNSSPLEGILEEYGLEIFKNRVKSQGKLIELTPDTENPTDWYSEGPWESSRTGKYTLYYLVVSENYHDLDVVTNDIFELETTLSKSQIQTNQQIQKQIVDTKRTNQILIGLTIILIGLAPLGFTINGITHFYFRNK